MRSHGVFWVQFSALGNGVSGRIVELSPTEDPWAILQGVDAFDLAGFGGKS